MKLIKTMTLSVAIIVLWIMDLICCLIATVTWYVYPVLFGVRLTALRELLDSHGYDGNKVATVGLYSAVNYVSTLGKDFVETTVRFGRFRR